MRNAYFGRKDKPPHIFLPNLDHSRMFFTFLRGGTASVPSCPADYTVKRLDAPFRGYCENVTIYTVTIMTRPPPLAFLRVVKANQFVFRGSNCLIGRPKGVLSATYGGARLCLAFNFVSGSGRPVNSFGGASGTGNRIACFLPRDHLGLARLPGNLGPGASRSLYLETLVRTLVRTRFAAHISVMPSQAPHLLVLPSWSPYLAVYIVSASPVVAPQNHAENYFSLSRCCNTQQWERRRSSHPKCCIYESFVERISYDVWYSGIGINDNISELRINGTLSLQGRYCTTGFRIELKRRLCPRPPPSTRRRSPSPSSSRVSQIGRSTTFPAHGNQNKYGNTEQMVGRDCQLGTVEVQIAGTIPGTLMVPMDSARNAAIRPRKYIHAHMRCNKETPMDSLRLERSQIK
ncbi:hypothetical protein EDB85DRAFT_1893269 [Lactarius pseudohatsudake]|nr:hypothetical protein EDB85DRAFT_1893269 [Lactarius pseudohatsudake]